MSVSFSPDGHTLASGSDDKMVKLWDIKSGRSIATFKGHQDSVWSVSFSPDGHTLASGSSDKTVKLWDVKSGKSIATLQGHQGWVYSVSFSPDGNTLASGSADGTVKLWDVKSRQEIATLQGHQEQVDSVSFSPIPPSPLTKGGVGGILASGSKDKTVRLWRVWRFDLPYLMQAGCHWLGQYLASHQAQEPELVGICKKYGS